MGQQNLPLFPEVLEDRRVDFLFVINPSKSISEQAKGFKEEFYQRFGSYPSRYSVPHITIANIEFQPKNQNKIISYILTNYPQINPFPVSINGFADFEKSGNKVIHLNVDSSKEFKYLEMYFSRMKMELHRYKKRFYVSENPHITIARNLQNAVFESAKKVYLPKPYLSSFITKGIKVLRREIINNNTTGYDDFWDLPFL